MVQSKDGLLELVASKYIHSFLFQVDILQRGDWLFISCLLLFIYYLLFHKQLIRDDKLSSRVHRLSKCSTGVIWGQNLDLKDSLVSQNYKILKPSLIMFNELSRIRSKLMNCSLNYIYYNNNNMIRQTSSLFGDIEIQFAVKIPHNNYRAMLYPLKTFRMN